MKKNSPRFFDFFKPGLFLVVFLFLGFSGFGQSIGQPVLTENVICNNSTIALDFELTSGAGRDRRYGDDSQFSVMFIPQNGSAAISNIINLENIPGNNSSISVSIEINIAALNLEEGEYSISLRSENPAASSIESELFTIINPTFYTEIEAGNDSWIGHVYDGANQNRNFDQSFNNYIGGYTENQSFDQSFGGDTNDFQLGTGNCIPSVYTESFAVRYRMNSSLKGLYALNIGSDDGSRLNVDGELIYNDWNDHAYRNQDILLSLSGNSDLVLDYYENSGGNRISVGQPQLLIENILSNNLNQTLNSQTSGEVISGDEFSNLPNGMNRFDSGYQWVYSTTENGETSEIPGATNASFTPNKNLAPFNVEGTYYIYRVATLTSSNNRLENNYRASITSNPATISIEELINIIDQPENVTTCQGQQVNFIVNAEGQNLTYQWQRNDGGDSDNFFNIEANSSFQNSRTSNLQVSPTENWLDNKRFRVIITDQNGNSITSNSALLNVNQSPQGINTQPTNQVVCEGNDISFQTYTSNDLRQWQVSEDNGSSWSDLSNNDFYQNVNSEKLDIVNTPITYNNNLYRIKVSNQSCSVYSNPATLQVDSDPITQQPQDVTAAFGEDAIIEAEISGENLTYQWQTYSSNWYDINDNENYSGTVTNRLVLKTVGYWPEDGSRYRLLITNENGCVSISEEAVLTIGQNPCENQNTWTGTQDTNWNNTANWSCNTLPTLETDVLIPEDLASGNYPQINSGDNAYAKNLTIENNATVDVNENWLRIAGDLTNNGILNTETGSISFQGTSAQIIPGAAFQNNRIQNLRIDNTSGVNSQAIIEVTGTLKVENGNFDTGDNLTLISDENQTALIDGKGKGEVTGLVSMQRYLDKAFGYKYFSSPFQNSVVNDFAPYMDFQDPLTEFPNFYRYEENRNIAINDTVRDATGWTVYTNPDNNLNIAEGYALNFGTSTDAQTIELVGEVNNGAIPARQLTNNHREYTRGFHLVGNPYPSPIDWNATQGWTKTNIDDGIYFFTASDTDQYSGTYTAFVNNISTENSMVDGRSSNIIPSMQGFFIKVSDSETQDLVTGSFGMDNNVRVTDFDQEFLRTQITDQKALIRLEAGFKETNRKDPMVIYFSSYATPNFEKEMDAHKLMNTDPAVPSFYNLTEDKKELAINAIPFPESRSYKKIPLGIKADKSGEMKINLSAIENLSPNFNIYLIDHAKSKGQNLSRRPEYTFTIKEGVHNSRFELMFSEEEVTNPAIAFNEPFDVEVRDGDVIIKMNLEEGQQGVLRASTMTGQILQVKSGGGKDEVTFDQITSDGVYIINLQLGKAQHAKKVLIKK